MRHQPVQTNSMQRQIGKGVTAVVSAVDGKAAVVVSVSQDLKGSIDAVELVGAGVAELGGMGAGGRPTSPKATAPTAPAQRRARGDSARAHKPAGGGRIGATAGYRWRTFTALTHPMLRSRLQT